MLIVLFTSALLFMFVSDDVPAALELALVLALGKSFDDGHSTSLASAKSNPPPFWSRSSMVLNLFDNYFLCQDACFRFRVSVPCMSAEEVPSIGTVEFGNSATCKRVVFFTIS